ncbi:MAG: selenium-dependent molybdenum cofactor biosynthesis protein YqeB [Chloroflexota bacterium]
MLTIILGGGDLASGVALRLYRAGLHVVITELAQPLAVRRSVSFAEAVYTGEVTVEGVTARRINVPTDKLGILMTISKGAIPVLVDPDAVSIDALHPTVVIDARMRKATAVLLGKPGMLIVGLGPGFEAGVNCSAVIETQRGPTLGRVYWQGKPNPDSGLPDTVGPYQSERVLRAPADGTLDAYAQIGDVLSAGQPVASVDGEVVPAPFDGLLRGLLYPGLQVTAGLKIGDLDPRCDPALVQFVSDKALAVGGAVLEAILSRPNLRPLLWK